MPLVDSVAEVKLWSIMSRWHAVGENYCPDSKPMRNDEIKCDKPKSNEMVSIRSEKGAVSTAYNASHNYDFWYKP